MLRAPLTSCQDSPVPTRARDELEAALAAGWDRDTLAVYADHLQSLGDPRGELIALDLEIEHRANHELLERRTALLSAWLGALAPSDPHSSWIGDSFRLGFVDDLVIDGHHPDAHDRLVSIMASPLASYFRRVSIHGDSSSIERALAILSDAHHAWLRWLSVRRCGDGPLVDLAVIHRFIAATPRLEVLDARGHQVLPAFPHPALRRLRLTGWGALTSIFDGVHGLAGVTELDLAFYEVSDSEHEMSVPDSLTIPPTYLPGLRRLDLSRNDSDTARYYAAFEPDERPDNDASPITALPFLASFAQRSQLTHLWLPALRSAAEYEALSAVLVDMPALIEIELARGHYYRPPDLRHPARFSRPAAWPWPSPDTIAPGESLEIIVPGSKSADLVSLADAIAIMEHRFDDLPADARYAWTRLWVTIAPLGPKDEPTFPAELLVAALESCEIETGGWRQLREELRYRRPLPANATVTISRSRGAAASR